jgi:transcriptional regulator with XRE-family HTH domain
MMTTGAEASVMTQTGDRFGRRSRDLMESRAILQAKIAQVLEGLRIPQTVLANLVDKHQSTVSNWVLKKTAPSNVQVAKIAEGLQLPFAWFLDPRRKDEPFDPNSLRAEYFLESAIRQMGPMQAFNRLLGTVSPVALAQPPAGTVPQGWPEKELVRGGGPKHSETERSRPHLSPSTKKKKQGRGGN